MDNENRQNELLMDALKSAQDVYPMLLEEFYPFFIVASLQSNSYSVVNGSPFFKEKVGSSGSYDDFLEFVASTLHPEYRGYFIGTFARDNLFTSFSRLEKNLLLDCTYFGEDEVYHWIRIGLVFLSDKEQQDSDIRFVLYFRIIDEEKKQELEARNFRRVFDMIIPDAFEYVAVVDVKNGLFEMFSHNPRDSHKLPLMGDYETLMSMLRDNMLPDAQKEDFFRATNLSKLRRSLSEPQDIFRYHYKTYADEEFEISFRLFNTEKTQYLMVIRRK